jgi:hypothetical protein
MVRFLRVRKEETEKTEGLPFSVFSVPLVGILEK